MKKILIVAFSLIMLFALFVGCSSKTSESTARQSDKTSVSSPSSESVSFGDSTTESDSKQSSSKDGRVDPIENGGNYDAD